MNPNKLFVACNSTALLGWGLLIFAGRAKYISTIVTKFIIPGLLSLVYVSIFVFHWSEHQGGFNSLRHVQLLFTDSWMVLLGWVHFLAFDLFLGSWQVRDAARFGLSHWWTIPTLVLTFLFGPLGFLLFLMIKSVVHRKL